MCCCFFFFNDTATTEIYTLSLHDALPILLTLSTRSSADASRAAEASPSSASSSTMGHTATPIDARASSSGRSEEHTSELQSHSDLVCRLLLEKKQNMSQPKITHYVDDAEE